MNTHNITVQGGESVRLSTAGKYCDRDIIVTAEGDGGTSVAVEEKDVNFYDYDGELLYSYTIAEAQALTELPPAPTPKKDFLVFDEWNWTLAQIKEYNNCLQIGAVYKTADGKTYATIKIEEEWQKNVTLRYCQWCSSVVVDWGDGNVEAPTTTGNGTNVTNQHTYAEVGTYTITVQANGTWNLGLNNVSNPFIGDASLQNGAVILRECYIGNGARIFSGAFSKARRLEKITIPKTATQTWSQPFTNCASLKCVIFPSTFTKIEVQSFEYCNALKVCSLSPNITTIGYNAFSGAIFNTLSVPQPTTVLAVGQSAAKKVIIPENGLTSIGGLCFYQTFSLTNFTVPETVTSIAANAFFRCYSLLRLKFLPTTPPAVANTNAFSEIPATCVVEVPKGTLAAYQAAANYSGIAAQMVESES
ncbi:MAG: leucine-rich repeat domain-containing protein [Clostridia bacterium]|nr:leucine-rich repeat domain-containing protein [Clostridia bacterium]